ncbi:MAG: PAS domain S-box protein [Methanomicrobiaceae archaeon]|uniref:PAS domain S-box protein n=1 Tax=Methanoculleus sp. TaxID=90427 RepID=UPI00320E70AC|nr:PAS domain S-box protein [Methanomicrobiaceae archaeon]
MQETPLDQQIQAVRQRIGELTREVPADPGDLLRAAGNLAAAATRAEEERQQLRDLLRSSPDGFVVTDADGRITDTNPAAAGLLGEPLAGTLLAACCHPDAQPEIDRMLADLRAGRARVSGETTLRSRGGAPVRVAITAAGCGGGEKRWLIREHPALQESRERDRLLARIEEERSLLQAIIEQMPEGVAIAEAPSGRLIHYNEQLRRIWGRPDMPRDIRAFSGLRPDGRPYLSDEWPIARSVASGEVVRDEELRILRADGTWIHTSISSAPIYDESGIMHYAVAVLSDVTDRKQMEEELQASEEKYRKLFENTSDAINIFEVVSDEHGEIVDWILRDANPVSQRDIGRRDETIGRRVTELLGAEEMAEYIARSREIMASGVGQRYENSFWGNRYYISSTFPIGKDLLGSVSTEITDRKRMEEELHLQQQRLELALSAARMIAWDWDPAAGRLQISGDFEGIYGRPPFARPEERLALVHPDDIDRLHAEEEHSGLYHTEYRIIRPDTGAVTWLESRGDVQRDEAGGFVRAVGVTMDVTKQKQSRQALEHQQELLQGIIDAIPVMITIYDPDIRFFRLNREIQRVFGWSEEDGARGDLVARFFPDPEYRKMADDYMRSLKPGWRDLLLTAKDGSVIETAWANIRLSDDTRVGIGIDIRERKRAEAAIIESEGRFRALMNASPNAVMLIDRDDTILILNEVAAERFGGSVQEVMGTSILDYLPPDVAARRKEIVGEVFATGRPARFVDEREGRILYNSLFPVADVEGDVVRIAMISYDITEQRRSEEMRHQAFAQIEQNIEQFAVLGDHIRLPLQVILAAADLMDDEQASERIRKQVWRINDIVKRLDRGWVESREIREFLRRHELV